MWDVKRGTHSHKSNPESAVLRMEHRSTVLGFRLYNYHRTAVKGRYAGQPYPESQNLSGVHIREAPTMTLT